MLIGDALKIIDAVCSEHMCNRQQRIVIEQSLAIVKQTIQKKTEKPKDKKKK